MVALLGWRAYLRDTSPAERALSQVTEPPPSPVAVAPTRRPHTPPAAANKPEPAPTSSRCIPDAAEHCLGGDVWLVDSCGRPEEKVEECGDQGCRDDECEVPYTEPCDEPPEGRCDGDVVRLCTLGRPVAIDCARRGMRCGHGDEGAECKPIIPPEARCDGPARCEKDVLLRCLDGQEQRVDCSALRSKCLTLPGESAPTCVFTVTQVTTAAGCGPCGCGTSNPHTETCDGRDENGDGLVDTGIDCGPVPVMAFIITGSGGETSHAREDVEHEIARVNQAFARTPLTAGLSFALSDVSYVADPALLTLDSSEVQALAHDTRVHPARDAFYVPIVFTDALLAGGDTPKPGLSTLPNGTCGGMQEGRGPEVGLVAVAKARYPTTVTHELGHFLGLCHTHDQQQGLPFSAYNNAQTGRLTSCYATCRGEGDGICDTPYDPGPEECKYDGACQALCQVSASPDTENLMGYYANCRVHFSDQQMALMQHTLALRRGWHRCIGGACACDLSLSDCPTDMTCRPALLPTGEASTRCGFDGPRSATEDCQSAADCGGGTLCMSEQNGTQRCVRVCATSTSGCTCTPASKSLSVCVEDFGARK